MNGLLYTFYFLGLGAVLCAIIVWKFPNTHAKLLKGLNVLESYRLYRWPRDVCLLLSFFGLQFFPKPWLIPSSIAFFLICSPLLFKWLLDSPSSKSFVFNATDATHSKQ